VWNVKESLLERKLGCPCRRSSSKISSALKLNCDKFGLNNGDYGLNCDTFGLKFGYFGPKVYYTSKVPANGVVLSDFSSMQHEIVKHHSQGAACQTVGHITRVLPFKDMRHERVRWQ
jgi:hypothetical protein